MNKSVLLVFLLLSVFAVGTLNFVDTIDAASWKKYDSGKVTDEYPATGYKKIASYQSYTKGNNQLYVEMYSYPKEGGSKKISKATLTKKKNIIKITSKNYFSNEKKTGYFETKWSVKKLYKAVMKENIKDARTPPKKIALIKNHSR